MAHTPWCGPGADKLYLTSGQFESTLKTSEAIGGISANPTGISWDGVNTPWCGAGKLYLTSGQFESTLKTSEDVSGIDSSGWGISWDGINTPWCGNEVDKLYLTSGQFESTLKTSEAVGGISNVPAGISWDGVNTPWCGAETGKLYLTSGQFESTLKTSEDISGIDSGAWGISTNNLVGRLGGIVLTEPLAITTSIRSDIEIVIPSTELSIITSINADIYPGASVNLTSPFGVTTSIAADLKLSLSAPFSVTTALVLSPTITVPNCVLGITISLSEPGIEIINTSNANRVYIFTLTGAADGVADIDIPISSFQSRLQSGDPTFLSVVIQGIEHLAAINARLNGNLVVKMGYKEGSTILLTEIISVVDFENIQYGKGAVNKSITLDGYRTESWFPKTVTLQGATYKNLAKGLLRFRCTPDLYLKPGDTAIEGEDSFTVTSISFSVSSGQETYEVAE